MLLVLLIFALKEKYKNVKIKTKQEQKNLIPAFPSVFTATAQIFFCRGDWTLACVSYPIWNFLLAS